VGQLPIGRLIVKINNIYRVYNEETGRIAEHTVVNTFVHDDDLGIVESVLVVATDQRMYNLTVNDAHTFYVDYYLSRQ